MQVKASELRKACEVLCAYLEQTNRDMIEMPVDYYWNIPAEYLYDPVHDPQGLNIGQLTDDWKEIQGIVEGKREPLGLAFVWLSAIFRAIGEKTVW